MYSVRDETWGRAGLQAVEQVRNQDFDRVQEQVWSQVVTTVGDRVWHPVLDEVRDNA